MEELPHERRGRDRPDPEAPYTAVIFTSLRTEADAAAWKQVAAHLVAQRRGQEAWYADYRVRVATVIRDYGPPR
ncbi:hypothetical protein [Nocardioides sp. Iso805N]|uniref:hypothetical protein n=1 Tax=Nocardioides sp. Iso805N TaxID=1283287 RepID=UPI00035E1859|nr:hypothetical protein [Nocardioides sp. Iso805N]